MGDVEFFTPRDKVGNGLTYGGLEVANYCVPN